MIQAWQRAFTLMASLELGREPGWQGPDDIEELKLRVETLAVLLALVPRNELDRLQEVVDHLFTTYASNGRPDLATLRIGIRRFLGRHLEASQGGDPYLARAEAAIWPKGAVVPPQVEPSVRAVDDDQQSYESCRAGIRAWFLQLATDRQWTHLSLFADDDAEFPIDDVFIDVCTVPDEDVEVEADNGCQRISRVAGRIAVASHAAIDAASMIARTSNFCIVIGDPGSGKSTLTQWIARNVSDGPVADFEACFVVKLGSFAIALSQTSRLTLLEYFFESLSIDGDSWVGAANWLRKAARAGARYLLLLDGWDEVPVAQREKVQKHIEDERHYFTIVVTSRPSGAPRRLAAGRHAEMYQIAGLSTDGQVALARRYLRALRCEARLPDLIRRLQFDSNLQELATNPFMLVLLTRAVALGGTTPGEWTLTELYRIAASWIVDVAGERNLEDQVRLSRSLNGPERLSYRLLFDQNLPKYVFSIDEVMRELDWAETNSVLLSRFVSKVVPTRESTDMLCRCLHTCQDTINASLAEEHAESMAQLARTIAAALAELDPEALLAFPAAWQPIDQTLKRLSNHHGWLVFEDQILDSEGNRVSGWAAEVGDRLDARARTTQPGETLSDAPFGTVEPGRVEGESQEAIGILRKDGIWQHVRKAVYQATRSARSAMLYHQAWTRLSPGEQSKRLREAMATHVLPKHAEVMAGPRRAGQQLAVNGNAFDQALAEDHGRMAILIAEHVSGGSKNFERADLSALIFQCRDCGAINPEIGGICRPNCLACGKKMDGVIEIGTRPDLIVECKPCGIEFAVLRQDSKKNNKIGVRLCPKCGKTELNAPENRR